MRMLSSIQTIMDELQGCQGIGPRVLGVAQRLPLKGLAGSGDRAGKPAGCISQQEAETACPKPIKLLGREAEQLENQIGGIAGFKKAKSLRLPGVAGRLGKYKKKLWL